MTEQYLNRMEENREPELETLTVQDHHGSFDDARRRACCLASKITKFIGQNLMLILTFAGIIIGFSLGFGIREINPSNDALLWIGMPGELFLRLLKLLILPLIVCSVISGSASLDPKSNGRMSGISFSYIIITNVLACALGAIIAIIVKPGEGFGLSSSTRNSALMQTQDIFADLLRNVCPENMVKASFSKSQTVNTVSKRDVTFNTTNGTTSEVVKVITKTVTDTSGTNVLGLITICTLVGIAAGRLNRKVKVFIQFFQGGTEVILKILRWVLWITPLGISSLIAVSIAGIQDITVVFEQLGMFVLAVTAGIVIHQFIFLPLLLITLTRRNPFAYLISMARVWMLTFAATSTAVAIPEMLQACEHKNNIDKRVSRFVIPFCVTLNADGSALYISTAAIFIANITGTPLSTADYVIICVLTGVATLALPSVPSSSIVTLVMVLTSLNIPADQISLLFAVEWYLDRIRTTSNSMSHTFCTAITYQFCKDTLPSTEKIPCDDFEIEIETPVTETTSFDV